MFIITITITITYVSIPGLPKLRSFEAKFPGGSL